MATNNPKLVNERDYNWAVWHAPIASAGGSDTYVGIYRHRSKPYPITPDGLLAAARVAMWDAFGPHDIVLTTTPVTLDGRPGVEVRFRQPTFNERVAKQNPKGGKAEPDDPDDVPDHTVLRVAADGRWLYVIHFRYRAQKPEEAVMKRVFDAVKLSPPAGP